MDTYFSETPAIGTTVKMAQIFVGRRTLVTDVYPINSEKQIPCTFEDNIKDRGAMETIISDGAKAAIGAALSLSVPSSRSKIINQNPTTSIKIMLRTE